MKKLYLFILLFSVTVLLKAQIITTSPAVITQMSGVIEIIYDATQGTEGLKDYTGTDGIYAHTGVITSLSTSSSDWKHTPAWGDNSEKYKLTPLGNNKWKLVITPSMSAYYSLSSGEKVNKLAFVFRNGLLTKEGKDTGSKDIFVDVFQEGLQVTFTNPTKNISVAVGNSINFTISSSLTVSILNLYLNGNIIKTVNGTNTLTHSQLFNEANDYTLIAEAQLSGQTVRDTLYVCVPKPVETQVIPAGKLTGINIDDNTTVTLVLHAPGKSNVYLLGDFNEWTQKNAYQLKKDGEYWWITLTGLTPGKLYAYQYLVDNSIKISDPYTKLVLDPWNDKYINLNSNIFPNLKAYPEGKTDGLVATFQTNEPQYDWEIASFQLPSKDNMVIYELLLRDFTVEQSLEAAILKLDYLKQLGITAVELMPIQEFDGNNSWGYNPNHYFAPDKAYGTPAMYKKFIDECHKRGIAVLLDVVLNHATGICPFALLNFDNVANKPAANNPWMNVNAPHPYSVYNDFNHSKTAVRDYFKRVLKYWLNEYKVDGYRLDLTKGLTQTISSESTASNYDQSRIDIITDYYNAAKVAKADVMFILEHFCNNDEETVLANKGMYLWRNVNNSFSQTAMGYQADSDFGGMYSSLYRWVGYAESHDEERNFYKAKMFGAGNISVDSIQRIGRVPLNIAFSTLISGPKMMYEFEEMGYDYSINSQGGRTNPKPSAWGLLNLTHRKSAYDNASKIINLRKLYPEAFNQGNISLSTGITDWNSGRKISLSHSDLNLLVLGNFNASATINATTGFQKTGTWYELLSGTTLNVSEVNMTIAMNAGEVKIYTDRRINLPNGVDEINNLKESKIYPTVTSENISIETIFPENTVAVYSLTGLKLMSFQNVSIMNLSTLSQGIYLIEIKCAGSTEVFKVIKK